MYEDFSCSDYLNGISRFISEDIMGQKLFYEMGPRWAANIRRHRFGECLQWCCLEGNVEIWVLSVSSCPQMCKPHHIGLHRFSSSRQYRLSSSRGRWSILSCCILIQNCGLCQGAEVFMIAQSFNVRLVTHVEIVEWTFLKGAATVFSLIRGPVAGRETDGRLQRACWVLWWSW